MIHRVSSKDNLSTRLDTSVVIETQQDTRDSSPIDNSGREALIDGLFTAGIAVFLSEWQQAPGAGLLGVIVSGSYRSEHGKKIPKVALVALASGIAVTAHAANYFLSPPQ